MTGPSSGAAPVMPPGGPTCYRHNDRVTNITCTRCGNAICPDCMNSAAVGFQCPSCVKQGNAGVRRATGVFGGRVTSGQPYVTYTLIAMNVVVFLATLGSGGLFETGIDNARKAKLVLVGGYGGSDAASHGIAGGFGVAGGDYYRLLSSCFVHFGLLHIASNMLVLYFIGPSLENVLGRLRFTSVYALAGLGGSVATYLFANPLSPEGGASGAIFGLFAAYVVVGRKLSADLSGIVGTIVINLVITFAVPGISITGHLGGLVVGAAAGVVITRVPKTRPGLQYGAFAGLLAVLVVLTVARTAALS